MTPEQFTIFLKENERTTAAAIEKYVNGGIRGIKKSVDDHNLKHESDMKRIMPVVEAYEDTVRGGKGVLWMAGFITAVGSAWIVLVKVFRL